MPSTDKPLTGYARLLKENGLYPLPPRTPWRERKPDRRHPPATPFLVIPYLPNDTGARPLDPILARHCPAIEIVDPVTHAVVATPSPGHAYQVRCQVTNRGAVGSYAGFAEFYVAPPAVLDALANGNGPRPAPLAYTGVTLSPGGNAQVVCPRPWTPAAPGLSIMVRIYDPLVDRPSMPYDPVSDRHVARHDIVPDFTGVYLGTESANQIHKTPTQIKIVIQQTGYSATVSIYSQAGGGIPAVPQEFGTASVNGSTFTFTYTEVLGNKPFTSNLWTFNFSDPNTLHFKHHRHYLQPGDGRPDTDTEGYLPRQ